MNEQQTDKVILAVASLAVAIRDEDAEAVAAAAHDAIETAGDPVAALCIAAALIRIDEPIDDWWNQGLDAVHSIEPLPPIKRSLAHRGLKSRAAA